jgi:hypothetical protein
MTYDWIPGTSMRRARPADEPFIISGWSSSYRMSRDCAFIQMDGYADVMHPIVRSVLARPRTQTIVSEGDVLRGFISFEHSAIGNPPLVHYVFVALPYRRRGIARGLFDAAGIDPSQPFEQSCRTRASWEIQTLARKALGGRPNSIRARFAEEEKSHG